MRVRQVDGKDVWNWKGIKIVPYKLPHLIDSINKSKAVILVEGEKDADNLGAERMNNGDTADYIQTINGQYQPLAGGVDIRFAGDTADTATLNDKWEVELRDKFNFHFQFYSIHLH